MTMTTTPEAPEAQVVLTFTDDEYRLIRSAWREHQEGFTTVKFQEVTVYGDETLHLTHVGMPKSVYESFKAAVGNHLETAFCYLWQRDDLDSPMANMAVLGWYQDEGGSWVCKGSSHDPFQICQGGTCGETEDTFDTGEIKPGHCGATVLSNGRKQVTCPACKKPVALT
jgi:hypothetical protein